HDDSFPSGHATIIFTFLTSLLLVIRKKWVIPLYVIGILVGYSRIALNVHYPGDVIVGAALGMAITLLVWRGLKTRIKA
ncbi:MAG: phosphatase PAP2 family protein, partial [Candidatus Aenigmatarchaeota archaeon]